MNDAALDAHAGLRVAVIVAAREHAKPALEDMALVAPARRIHRAAGTEAIDYHSGGVLLIQVAGTDMRGYSLDRIYVARHARIRANELRDLRQAVQARGGTLIGVEEA
ncbi:hypothetical protein [Microbacterium gubbeenense]|uniref:hypothetical protein n=1 Tax=Microbacterium gubbeenense TaxID=159896 RepID=UPI00041C2B9E|nr:hypothetical protein [Microbacterium gubbeenense]